MMDPRISRRISQGVFLGIGIGIALWLLITLGEKGVEGLATAILTIGPLAWVIFSGNRWWMLLPMAITFGGVFVLEFKILTHEVAFPLCILALLPMLATRRLSVIPRASLPRAAGLLLLLMLVTAVVSLYLAQSQGVSGIGSIFRIYYGAIWAVVFLIAFYHFGSTKHLKSLLVLLYCISLIRIGFGLLVFSLGRYLYIPHLNYVLGGLAQGLTDFRFTGLLLVIMAFLCFQLTSKPLAKLFHAIILVLAIILVTLGAARVSIGMLCLIPIIWAVVRRKFGWIATFSALILSAIVFLNQKPETLYSLPENAQRALSILIRESSTRWIDQHDAVRLSNEWHHRLMVLGFERWTDSPLTVLFGNRVEPFDRNYDALSATIEVKAQVASRMALLESGIWSVLAMFGATGFLLYAWLFFFLLKGPLLAIRENGVRDVSHLFCAWGVIAAILWFAFSWIAGGVPSYELMLAAIAKAAYEDDKRRNPAVAEA